MAPPDTRLPAPSRPPARAWLWLRSAAAAVTLVHIAAWLTFPTPAARAVLNGAFSVLAFSVSTTLLGWAALRSRQRQPAAARVWTGLAIAHALLLVPNTWWLAVATVPALHGEPLTRFDPVFALVVLALFAGLASLPTRRVPRRDRLASGLEVGVVALASMVLAWTCVAIATGAPTDLAAIAEIAAGTAFLTILSVVCFRALDGQTRPPLLWFAAGVALAVVDIVAYAIGAPVGAYDNGGPTVLFMAAGAWTMGLGGLRQVRSCAETTTPAAETPAAAIRLIRWLPMTLVAAAFAVSLAVPGLPPEHLRLGIVAVAMTTLLMVRQVLALRRIDALYGELTDVNTQLESRIEARTADLTRVNAELVGEIRERQRVERTLLERERRLAEIASRDGLTGLLNRSFFLERLGQVLAKARRDGAPRHAVLFLDLDSFKVINDSLGHRIGDLILVEIARRIESAVRGYDVVARLGGDEFVVLLDGISGATDAELTAGRIQQAIAAPLTIEGHAMHCTASIGVVMGRVGDEDVTEVIRDADLAMYHAKANGKGRHALYSVELHTAALARLNLETDLRTALDKGEFRLVYQPIYSLRRRAVAGFEALLRWDHPVRGLIPPTIFIPVAESTGLILPIGRWVLEEACRQAAAWRALLPEAAPLTMSVNLSARQFAERDLPTWVEDALAQSGLPPALLIVEITESAIVEDGAGAEAMLAELRAMGVRVHLDDFGIGYSSLAYLHRFPLDGLKIDRSFVSRLQSEGEHTGIIGTIVGLAHALGLTVTAEGIETREQVQHLDALECEFVQGYLIARPARPEAVVDALVGGAWGLPAGASGSAHAAG